MTKRRRVLLAILILTAAFSAHAADISVPSHLDLFAFSAPPGGPYGYSKPLGQIYGFPVFRIWGWSPDGKMAYTMERPIEGRGGVEVTWAIQDLVSDETVWSFTDDSYNWDGYDEGKDGSAIAYSLRLNRDLVAARFASNAIRPQAAEYRGFPASLLGHTYACMAAVTWEADPDFSDAVKDYRIVVRRDNKSEKTVKAEKSVHALRVYVCGWFKSPYENRIAIVTAEERFVFEGTELFYSISGCNLQVGF